MTAPAHLALLLSRLDGARASGSGKWTARCPAHDDKSPSLSIAEGMAGRVLLKCHAGCSLESILSARGLALSDLGPEQRERIRVRYEVCTRAGDVVAVHERTDKPDGSKAFMWRRPDGTAGLGGLAMRDLPLFGAELLDAEEGPVIVTEGEKAAGSLRSLGRLALGTVTGAAVTPSSRSLEDLRGRDVILWPDCDEPGRVHMERVSAALQGIASSVRLFTWGTSAGDDAADFVGRGGTADELARLLDVPAIVTSGTDPEPSPVPAAKPTKRDAPEPLQLVAYHGPLGELVRVLEPQTEADPAAVLLQLLAAFGSIVGSGPFAIGGGRHHANLFVAIIGKTAKARKGVSMSEALRIFRLFEVGETWLARRVLVGLSSGEGIVSAVRDPGGEDVGEGDKRVLFREEELARIMAAGGREGSTLSSVLRQAWDSAPIGIVTKAQRMHCAEPHVSVIAHCTRDELGSILGRRDLYNGLANRFLWTWASRSKLLPHGGSVREAELKGIAADIAAAVDHALTMGDALVPWSDEARGLWEREYPDLSKERPGSLGAILARSEAHVLRLSLVFALADRSRCMTPEHLSAALAVWRYCAESARVIFGEKSGDRMGDKFLSVLRGASSPMTQAAIAAALGWNYKAHDIAARLEELHAEGWLELHEGRDGKGRAARAWTLSGTARSPAA